MAEIVTEERRGGTACMATIFEWQISDEAARQRCSNGEHWDHLRVVVNHIGVSLSLNNEAHADSRVVISTDQAVALLKQIDTLAPGHTNDMQDILLKYFPNLELNLDKVPV